MAYISREEVRSLERMSDVDAYPDTMIDKGIAYAEWVIDEHTGTTWEHKPFTGYLAFGRVRDEQGRTIIYPRTITEVAKDGVVEDDVTGWAVGRVGCVYPPSSFTVASTVREVSIKGTAGFVAAPTPDIVEAAESIARIYCVNKNTRIPDRALTQSDDLGGTIKLAQPGTKYPTGVPAIDAILNANIHRHGGVS